MIIIEILLIVFSNVLITGSLRRDNLLYRIEAKQIAKRMETEHVEDISLSDYKTIVKIEPYDDSQVNYDYIVAECDGVIYRIGYEEKDNTGVLLALNICLGMMFIFSAVIFIYIDRKVLKPFNSMTDMTVELAKGNLTKPITEEKSRFFGKFLWGMDMLRENLEDSRRKELEYQKEKKTLVLSLSHDIKTPLSAIELYTKALKEGIYDSEEKKAEALNGILKNADEIKRYAGEISKISREDFLDLKVNVSEVYIDDVINKIEAFYHDRLSVIHTGFSVERHTNCLLLCDPDRLVEVLQNFMENAIKYGDGKSVKISFGEEEGYKLICVTNTGTAPDETDMQSIFDSFYRGKNTEGIQGSGLGLYICKNLMQKMDGDAYAEAVDGGFRAVAVVKIV
jgi:signal transduction histidine kinase